MFNQNFMSLIPNFLAKKDYDFDYDGAFRRLLGSETTDDQNKIPARQVKPELSKKILTLSDAPKTL